MADSDPTFASHDEYRQWLARQATLPPGFRVGAHRFTFTVGETGKQATMALTLMALDEPTPSFAAVFTRNAFPGAPVRIGRARLDEPALGAVVVNNKISNVCASGGVATSERICEAVGAQLGIAGTAVLPSSTGVIGWRLPAAEMVSAIPDAAAALQAESMLPAAEGIVTTDLYPKLRRVDLPGGGSIVGIAKGAGMIEPNLATMLVYLLTDVDVPRPELRALLAEAVGSSFNAISIDSDQSTSDSVVCLSSRRTPLGDLRSFAGGLQRVCGELAEDVVRNGEGVRHVQRVLVTGAPSRATAKAVGKAVINSPLWKTALAGNDPNVGRLVMAVGKELGDHHPEIDPRAVRIDLCGERIFQDHVFHLDPEREARLAAAFQAAELYPLVAPADGLTFRPPVDWPPHPKRVEIAIDLGAGPEQFTVIGNDLTHEYITENADYRS